MSSDYKLYDKKDASSIVPVSTLKKRNDEKSWEYGYNEEYDLVVISKDGTVGDVYVINSVRIALPSTPKEVEDRGDRWHPQEYPKELEKVKTIFDWNRKPKEFHSRWVDYVESEFDRREYGFWFMNNKKPTYITGTHYMYLQWTKIDVGLPDFREANRIFFIYFEACKADNRCFGMIYLKNRRSGFSFMSASEIVNQATMSKDARFGILSKTGDDAKKLFTDKVVNISNNYPFFFKPIQDGMDRPKTELAYRVPASKITKRSMVKIEDEDMDGLNTTIDWKNTADNSYDGEKVKLLIHDECYDPNTKILCSDMEFRPIKDINVGDKVIVEGGKVMSVVKTTHGHTDMYKVKQKWSKDYFVSRNHRLYLHKYIYDAKTKTGKRIPVVMTPEQYLLSSKFAKQHLFSVKSAGIEYDDSEKMTIHPYLLGLWLGDGRKREFTITINKEKDPEIIEYLGYMSQFYNIPFDIEHSSTSKKVIYFKFKGINHELKNIGVKNNKHIPEFYKKSSIEARLQLIAGLIDSDGYVDRKKGSIELCMKNRSIIEDVRFMALSSGISCSEVYEKNTNFNTKAYRIVMSGNIAEIPTIVARKNMSEYKNSYSNRRCGVDVERIGVGEYYGIQVNADNDDDRRLILEDFTLSMNSGKWVQPNNILNNWRVTKTCLRLGSRIIGKCMMGSTSNALDKGGGNFKKLYEDSDPSQRNDNGQTKSGLYRLFIPMEWNFEGYIDVHGMPVFHKPKSPIRGVDGSMIKNGVIDYWENEVASLKSDADALNEFYRQFPRTESHAFRDESKASIFNLTKIYQQIDYNGSLMQDRVLTRGYFHWKDGKKDTEVVWTPDNKGRFIVSWLPPVGMRNNTVKRGDSFYPGNEHVGSFGCDPYDISGVVGGGGSNGALHGLTKFHMDDGPSNRFFLEYIARPQTAEIFFEDVLMACFYYGMPVLAENNKPRLLYHFKNRGYRAFSMNRPDKQKNNLSKTEKELGGIPNTSEDVKQSHASAIETYIEKYVGIDLDGVYRSSDEMGYMYFNRTLEDWARFDINNRTRHDASISSGLAIMANKRHDFISEKKQSKISVKFATYNNKGYSSEIIK